MAAQIYKRGACAVRIAEQIDLVEAHGMADVVEIVDGVGGRVLRQIGGFRERVAADADVYHRDRFTDHGLYIVRIAQGAREPVRAAGAALIDENDVALLADFRRHAEEREELCGALSGTAG